MFQAKFSGNCSEGDRIAVGELIERSARGYRHANAKDCFNRQWVGFKNEYAARERQQELAAYEDGERREAQAERSWNEQQYQLGRAEGERYSMERKMYGDALAEQFAMQDEMNAYNRGDDY